MLILALTVAVAAQCATPLERGVERHYVVAARIRPLLFWIGPRDVGRARIAWREAADGTRRLELLIGTDPERTPMRINRWGYIAETMCGSNAELFGIMTESEEATIESAQASVAGSSSAGRAYKAIRAKLVADEASTEILRITPQEAFTFRDLESVIGRLPPPGTAKRARIGPGIETGFLAAVSSLLREATVRSPRTSTTVTRPFLYSGETHDLTLRSSRVMRNVEIRGRAFDEAIAGEFQIKRRSSGATTDFQITFGTSAALREVPLRIIYRPRWWLELDLALEPAP